MKLDLLSKIEKNIKKYKDGCWIWLGYFKDHKRLSTQPILQWNGSSINVRAYLYAFHKGTFPPKKLCRKCLNAKCVNPDHMSLIPPTGQETFWSETPNDTELQQGGVQSDGSIRGGFQLPKITKNID